MYLLKIFQFWEQNCTLIQHNYLQTMCGDGVSKSGCFVTINEDLTSCIVNMKPVYANATGISISKPHMLLHRSSGILSSAIRKFSLNSIYISPICQGPATSPLKSMGKEPCGTVDILYPFGMDYGDYMDDRFRVTCNKTNNETVPYIQSINQQLLKNIFWSLGCVNLATVLDCQTDHPIGGCLQHSCRTNKEASDVNVCFIYIPHGLNSCSANMTKLDSSNSSERSCGFASVDYKDFFVEWNSKPELCELTHVPTTLRWGTPKMGLCRLKEGFTTLCSTDRQFCWQNLSPTHLCVCSRDRHPALSYDLEAEEQSVSMRILKASEGAFLASQKGDSRFKDKGKSKFQCTFCGKSGHTEKFCWTKKKEAKKKHQHQPNASEENQEDEDHLFMVSRFVESSNNSVWLVDSGCTNHMKPVVAYFSLLDKSFETSVKMENGAIVQVHGIGSISVNTPKDLPKLNVSEDKCDSFQLGKSHRLSFSLDGVKEANLKLELVHSDFCGPMNTSSTNGNKYFVLFIEDLTMMCWVYFLMTKLNVLSTFKEFKIFAENQSDYSYCNWEKHDLRLISKELVITEDAENRETGDWFNVAYKNDADEIIKTKSLASVKWAYGTTFNLDDTIFKHKVRLVVKGYAQIGGVDYDDSFAPVARLDTIRLLIVIASQLGWNVFHLDVKSAFLNGELEEDIHVFQPEGFVVTGKEHQVYKLKRALCGIKQAPRACDWAGSLDDMKSTSGYIFNLGSGAICWSSKKQQVVAQSTMKVEYIVVVNQAIRLRNLLSDLGFKQENAIILLCDNKYAIAIAENLVQHGRTKHINVNFNVIREVEKNSLIKMELCSSEMQVADLKTKALSRNMISIFKHELGITNISLKVEC
ncbi:hypothetical protein GQ457_02G043350 [Hibiscus cannabinus]